MVASSVYGFRLNEKSDSIDEKRAKKLIDQWIEQGYDIKQIVIPLVLQHAGITPVSPEYLALQTSKLLASIDDLRVLVDEMRRSGGVIQQAPARPQPAENGTEISADDPMLKSLMQRGNRGKRTQ